MIWLVAAAVVQLKVVASVVVSDDHTPDSVTSQLSFLQTLLSNIVSIVANYIDSEDKYDKSSTTNESRLDNFCFIFLDHSFKSSKGGYRITYYLTGNSFTR